MNQQMIDAIRTTGQLLLHHPTTQVMARDKNSHDVHPLSKNACRFCFMGAIQVVAHRFDINWGILADYCEQILRLDKFSPNDWDHASLLQKCSWSSRLAHFGEN